MGLKARRSDLFSDAHSINQRGSITTLRHQLFGGFFAFSIHTRVLLWEKRVSDVNFRHHCNLNHPNICGLWKHLRETLALKQTNDFQGVWGFHCWLSLTPRGSILIKWWGVWGVPSSPQSPKTKIALPREVEIGFFQCTIESYWKEISTWNLERLYIRMKGIFLVK